MSQLRQRRRKRQLPLDNSVGVRNALPSSPNVPACSRAPDHLSGSTLAIASRPFSSRLVEADELPQRPLVVTVPMGVRALSGPTRNTKPVATQLRLVCVVATGAVPV